MHDCLFGVEYFAKNYLTYTVMRSSIHDRFNLEFNLEISLLMRILNQEFLELFFFIEKDKNFIERWEKIIEQIEQLVKINVS